jgi:hypothetical protein
MRAALDALDNSLTETQLTIDSWRIILKIKLAGYIDAAGEQLLLNKKNQFQLLALRYAKLR